MNLENQNTNRLPLTLNVVDVAKALGISKAKAYELCNSEGFPCVRIGKRRLIIPKAAFVEWMKNPKL